MDHMQLLYGAVIAGCGWSPPMMQRVVSIFAGPPRAFFGAVQFLRPEPAFVIRLLAGGC